MDTDKTKQLDKCRICLQNVEAMLNIFEDQSNIVKIALCCGVEILNVPTLSSKLCKKCLDKLNLAYDFRVLCQRSQRYLNNTENTLDGDELKPDFDEINAPSCVLQDDSKYEDDQQSYSNDEDQQEDNNKIVKGEHNVTAHLDVPSKQLDDSNDTIKIKEEDKAKVTKTFRTRNRVPKPKTVLMCNICGNIYNNKATFSYHMKMHKNDKKYECEICSKRFMQTCDLRTHIRVHTGEKPFNCSYCDRKFSDRGGVTRHERTHTNERPYGCNICGTHFSYSTTLKKHKRVHTGEKPFKCVICNKQFSESHQLKAHQATIKHREMAHEKSKTILLS